jgi:branched-chain amino acid transport system ATP-binding protein
MPEPPLLQVSGLRVAFGRIEAVRQVALEVAPGEIVALIGANGAGKTTTLRALSGLESPSGGTVRFKDRDITGLPAHARVALGLVHVPEGRRIFPALTVRENLEMAGWTVPRQEARHRLEEALAFLPRLRDRLGQLGGTLSGGEQQLLALGRALVTGGELLLLDEPSMGLAPQLAAEIFGRIRAINARGTAILLVEQNAAEALRLATRAHVLEVGRTALSGTAADLAQDPQVRRAYLGI